MSSALHDRFPIRSFSWAVVLAADGGLQVVSCGYWVMAQSHKVGETHGTLGTLRPECSGSGSVEGLGEAK